MPLCERGLTQIERKMFSSVIYGCKSTGSLREASFPSLPLGAFANSSGRGVERSSTLGRKSLLVSRSAALLNAEAHENPKGFDGRQNFYLTTTINT